MNTNGETIQALLDQSSMGFARLKFAYDQQGNPEDFIFLDINQAIETITGFPREQLIGASFKRLWDIDVSDINYWVNLIYKLTINGESQQFDYYSSKLDKYLKLNIISMNPGHFSVFVTDITLIKNKFKQISSTSQQYQKLFQHSGDALFIHDLEGQIVDINHQASLLLGFSGEELKKMKIQDLSPDTSQKQISEGFQKLRRGSPTHVETQVIRKDGTPLLLSIEATLYDEKKELVLGSARDITQEKQRQQEYRKLYTAVEQGPAIVVVCDVDGNIEYTNKKFQEITGFTCEDVKGKNPRILKSGLLEKKEYTGLWKKIKSGTIWHGTFHNKKKNGQTYWEEAVISPVFDENGKIANFVKIAQDITKLKETREALKKNREQLQSIINNLPGYLVVLDEQLSVIMANNNWMSVVPEKAPIINEIAGKKQIDLINTKEKTLLKEWAMKLDEVEMESLKSGQTLVKVMNWEEKVYKIMMAPLRSQDDSVTGVVEYALDITELEEAKVKAQEASRAKSEFLAHMSHEIRTPLNAVIGFSDLLKNTPLNTSQKKYLNNINTSATLLMDLINDILDFSKIESGKLQLNPEPANIIEIMQNTLQFVKPAIRNKPVKLSFTQEGTIPERIEIDVVRIRQIITNLLSNAVKFTQKGEIELKVAAKSQNKNGQTTLSFTVRDTGIGISKENQKKIFEAFAQADPSTTKRFGGTGLGLTITNKLLKMMNSKLALLSEPGKGSDFSFTLSLPEVSGETTTEPPEMEKVTLKKKSEIFSQPITIMISEDNILNIEMTEVFLSTLLENATIVKASNGLEAIKQYRKNKPDMIFMDIQMPQMNGYEATKNIRKLAEENNDKPLIIAFSATSLSEEKKKAFEAGMDDYMTKPVSEKNFEQILLKHASHLSASKSESTQAADQLHHFNREQFERKMGNDQEAIQHIIQIGRKALDNGEIHLTAAFESKDPTTIQKAAHQLKGMAANMHFDILQSLTVEMETLAEQGESLPKLEILLKEIKNEIALLREIKKPPE